MIYAIVGTFELGFMIHSQMPATKNDEIFKLSINKRRFCIMQFDVNLHIFSWCFIADDEVRCYHTTNGIYYQGIRSHTGLVRGPPADTTAAASGRERRGNYDVRWDSQGSTNYRYLVVLCQRMIICIRSAKHFQLLLFVFLKFQYFSVYPLSLINPYLQLIWTW